MAQNDGFVRYTIRVPERLYERIKRAAGMKSVNAEIVAALEEKYPDQEFHDLVTALGDHVESLPDDDARRAFLRQFLKPAQEDAIERKLAALRDARERKPE